MTGNYVGTDISGTKSLGNTFQGVAIISGAQSNVISGNVISANGNEGVQISGISTAGNLVQANYIGTNAAGTAALGNAASGVSLINAANNSVLGNVISGNASDGVNITGNGAPAGTVSWYRAEGNANDAVGSNNGTITTEFSGQVSFVNGISGQAFDFNGANFVEVPPIPLNSFTVDLWLNQRTRSTVANFGAVLVSNEVCGAVDDWHLGLLPDGHLFFRMGDQVAGQDFLFTSSGVIPLVTDTHVGVTRSTTSGNIELYINGALDSTFSAPHNRVVGASKSAATEHRPGR